MKVYRGPSSKPFEDESHQFVSQITPEILEEGIRSDSLIKFNITKDGYEREAVCTVRFEEADLIPMINGLLSRLTRQQERLKKIKDLMNDKETSDNQKVTAVKMTLLRK
jgi:hypothetical protein